MAFARRLRVLVVDDCKDTVESMAMLLDLWGYGTRTCCDGPAALEVARAYRPHVVLLDIKLPGMDGFEVARRLCEPRGPSPPVLVAITARAVAACRLRAYEMGFAHYLIKPVDPDDLRGLLREMEGRPGLRETTPDPVPLVMQGGRGWATRRA
ncbi:MAG TPA: response regulator [Gemmataceae bacterium]|nr:response regulator [Gemmataceae bacterium]